MAPVNQLGVLAFASAVLAVPHVQPFHKRHAHASAPAYKSDYVPVYGGSSSSYAAPVSSGPAAYGSSWSAGPASSSYPAYPAGSSSSYAGAVSSSVIYYGSSSSAAPVPSASSFPSCWATCFAENGNPSEEELCGNEAVSKCICDTCSEGDDKTYRGWLVDFCSASPSSSYAAPVSSSVIYYGSSSSAAPVPSGSGFPECWGTCFSENGNPSEAELCGNDDVSACIHKTCSPAEDKAYWDWYNSYCSAASSSSYAAPVSSAPYYPISSGASSGWAKPTGGYGNPSGGFPSYSTCTETSTLIYRSTTAYSTYYVTHTIYKSEAAASSAAPAGDGPGYPAGSAPAYNAVPASSAAPISEAPGYGAPSGAPVGPAGGDSCVPDATVTTTVKTTVYVTPEGPYGGAPTSEAAPSYPASSAAWPAPSGGAPSGGAPSYPAAPSSAAPASSGWGAPGYPSASASEAPAPSYSAPVTHGSVGGRGIAYNDVSLANSLAGGKAGGFAYNWISNSGGLDSSIPYIPMLHDTSDDFTSVWQADAEKGIANGAEYLFSFNEPDMSSQANLSPEAAAAAWKQYMEPFAGRVKLVAPSVTNGQGEGVGLSWLTSFLDACSDCTIDSVNMHWYYTGNPIDEFKSQITAVAEASGKGVWLSEFGADGSDEDKSSFLAEALPWLDSNDSILGYSYFMVADGSLMTGTSPSSWGASYCN